MAIETKEQVLEKILEMEKPCCPHCNEVMSIWEAPLVTFSDGIGWGEPYLFLCFNDECALYKSGWDNLQEHYAQHASYRCFCYPSSGKFEVMPVFGSQGAKGQQIDETILAEQEALKENIKKGFSILAECYVSNDGPTVMKIILDPTEPSRVRLKAAEMIGDIGGLDAVDPLRDLKVGNELVDKELKKAVARIHERFFTRECPFCAEIIKDRAKICKHCGKEVAGQ
jgi:hypothetical protein